MRSRVAGSIAAGCLLLSTQACSSNTARTSVPLALVNAYPATASALLCARGLRPLYVAAPDLSRDDAGINGYAVRSAQPTPGVRLDRGSAVRLTLVADTNLGDLHQAPKKVQVPNVIGLDVNKAVRDTTVLGLLVDVHTATPTGSLHVVSETPAPGTTVPGNAIIDLTVGRTGSTGCH